MTHSKNYKDESKTRINQNLKFKGLKYFHKQLITDNSQYIIQANKYSIRPSKVVCDITGLPANYKCPRTQLYYHDLGVYEFIRNLSIETAQRYIKLRNMGRNIFSFQKEV